MWAINKSPLMIGAPMNNSITSDESLKILSNKHVIAINQDKLGKQAKLTRRFTEEEYDIYAGELSNSRLVIGIANWKNNSQNVAFDMGSVVGFKTADVYDVWANEHLGALSGMQSFTLKGHELKLLILSNLAHKTKAPQSNGYIAAYNGQLSGHSQRVSCQKADCLPVHKKVTAIDHGSFITFANVHATKAGVNLVGVDYINYDIGTTNMRNMTISVNGGQAKRWGFPISGGDWFETGRLDVEVDGFAEGDGNVVVFAPFGENAAPDLVGFEVFQ